jgi:hypothetical protein
MQKTPLIKHSPEHRSRCELSHYFLLRLPPSLPTPLQNVARGLGIAQEQSLAVGVALPTLEDRWTRHFSYALSFIDPDTCGRIVTLRAKAGRPLRADIGWLCDRGWAQIETMAGHASIATALLALARLIQREQQGTHERMDTASCQSIELWHLCLALAAALAWGVDIRVVFMHALVDAANAPDSPLAAGLCRMADNSFVDFADTDELARYARTHFALCAPATLAAADTHAANHQRVIDLAHYLKLSLAQPSRTRQ